MLTAGAGPGGEPPRPPQPCWGAEAPTGGAPGAKGTVVTEQAMSLRKGARPSATALQARTSALEAGVRLVGAMLALAVAAVHVADQGGITALATPDWIGWGYRLIEVGGVLTALALLIPVRFLAGIAPVWLAWGAGILLGAGPFIGYVAS